MTCVPVMDHYQHFSLTEFSVTVFTFRDTVIIQYHNHYSLAQIRLQDLYKNAHNESKLNRNLLGLFL